MSSLKPLLEEINLVLLPVVAAAGAFLRELVGWLRGNKIEEAQALRSDMEVGKALRDELLQEIARQDAQIRRAEEECAHRIAAMESILEAVQKEADIARDLVKQLRTQLDEAERTIDALKKQVAILLKFSPHQGDA